MADSTLVIFSDLDGTLLDHRSYDFSPAQPALDAIHRSGVPLVLATSKTEAELRPLRKKLGLDQPAIVENGGGVIVPENYFGSNNGENECPAHPAPCARIRETLDALPPTLRRNFTGFGDWSEEEVAARTGLDIESARLAKARAWSEPGLWQGDEESLSRFESAMRAQGLTLTRGGRFLHVMGDTDKARMMAWLVHRYTAEWGKRPCVAALGDAPNDAAMLDAADFAYIIPNPAGDPVPALRREASNCVRRIDSPGPEGWNSAVLDLLDRLKLTAEM